MINIIPTPKSVKEKDGVFSLSKVKVCVSDGVDCRVKKAAAALAKEIGKACREAVAFTSAKPEGRCVYVTASGNGGEGYTLTVNSEMITVDGKGDAGAFYGIQSLRQLIRENGIEVPCCVIEDEPDFAVRGFYQDITRGRVNKLEKLKSIADKLSYYKINSLQLYVEDAFMFKEFEGIITADEAMTPDEMLEFDSYCHDRFIELVPSLSTFGHLFTLLQSEKYNYICELGKHEMTTNYWMEKQWHHTVNVYEPDTIKVIGSMIEQYIPLFRSDKFNICCDETMDLCNGKNKGKDKGEAYFYHLNKVVDIVKSHGKTVMLWGDECMARPELMKQNLPSDAIILNWCYNKSVNEWIPKFFWERGFKQIVCPGTISWSKFLENIDASVGNISEFAAHAKKYGALGVLNTNWGDFGHICSFNCNLYGMLFGAQKSWNVDAETGEEFRKTASFLLYGTEKINMIDTIYALGQAELTGDWFRFVMWHSANCLEGRSTELKFDEAGVLTSADVVKNIGVCRSEAEKLRSVVDENDDAIGDVILAARAIELMNRLYLYVNGVDGYTDSALLQNDFNEWLKEYEKAWLRDDKPSQLPRLSDFISHITEVPVRKNNG